MVHFIHAYMYSSITCQQNYLSINGHQKIKETSILKIVNLKKGIGIERYTQFTTDTLIMKKVPKQDEHISLLATYMRLQVKNHYGAQGLFIMHRTKINSKACGVPILTAI